MGMIQAIQEYAEGNKNNVHFKYEYQLYRGELTIGLFKPKYTDLSSSWAEVIEGAEASRMTLTRVGAGAVFFGPAGAVVGALARKDKSKHWLVLHLPDGDHQMEFGQKDAPKAHEFVMKFNNEARRQLELRGPAE